MVTTEPPLLALAAGKKVRLRKGTVPPAKELSLHIAVAQLLKVACNPDWRWTHIPSGEHRDIRTAAKLKAMGVKPGWPDFIFIGPSTDHDQIIDVAFLELKRKGKGRLSDEQRSFQEWCYSLSIPHAVADNVDDAIEFLRAHGIVNIRK